MYAFSDQYLHGDTFVAEGNVTAPTLDLDHQSSDLGTVRSTDSLSVARLVDLAILPAEDHQEPIFEERPAPSLLALGVNDEGNAEAVTIRHPDRFLHSETHGWIQYTGVYYDTQNAEAGVDRAVVETLSARIEEAVKADAQMHEKLIRFCVPNSNRIRGTKDLLKSKVAASPNGFDVSPDLLNCPNGVVDLRRGELLRHSPSYRFMHVAGVYYDHKACYSAWRDWLINTVGSEDVERYLQRAVGYSLTGHTSEEVLFYLFGPPRSGKGTFTETLRSVMGDQLAKVMPFSGLTAKADVDAQNFALAPLKPTRLVLASESNSYERFNEAKLKAITGGDSISCAFKHHDAFNYRPQFKVWLSSNQPVNADPYDDAVWGRIRVVHFPTSHLGCEDKSLKARIKSNLPGVLAWAVAGAVQWYRMLPSGLPELPDSAVLKDLQRAEIDYVDQWIDEKCCLNPEKYTGTGELYESYARWCRSRGVMPKQVAQFSQVLKRKGYAAAQKRLPGGASAVRGFTGLFVINEFPI